MVTVVSSSSKAASVSLKSKRCDELANRLIDGVGQLVRVDFGYDVEGGHGSMQLNDTRAPAG